MVEKERELMMELKSFFYLKSSFFQVKHYLLTCVVLFSATRGHK